MYDVISVDLTNTFDNQKVVPASVQIGSVAVVNLPSGAAMQFKIGNGPLITARDGLTIDNINPREEGNLGLFVKNVTAQPGVLVELFIGLAPTTPTKVN